MRTTLTLDDDVAALLKRVLAGRKDGLKAVVNEALRQGLRRLGAPLERKANYQTPSVDTGRCLLPNVDRIAGVLAVTEDDRHLLG
jgi:hypothetical protein